MTELKAECVAVDEIAPAERREMFLLMDAYYANVAWSAFLKDLADKQWVLCIRAEGRKLVGFSTQKLFTHRFHGRPCHVVFSGDTVIDKAYRGSRVLAAAFGKFMSEVLGRYPATPLYWLLISKGIRTYRYLPLYFHEFYPRFDRPTPAGRARMMASLGTRLFPERFDPARGILAASGDAQRLREFDAPERDSVGPHWRFFLRRNPGYFRGEELVCLASFSRSNVCRRIWTGIDRHPPLLPQWAPPAHARTYAYASLF